MDDFDRWINFPPSNPPKFDQQGRLHFCIDADTITGDFANEHDEQARERLKRFFSAILDYTRPRVLPTGDHEVRLDNLSSLLESISVSHYQRPLAPPTVDRSLLYIVAEILNNNLFATLGPESQRPGPVTGNCRFVCIFCHEVKKRTGDIRVHLHKKHGCDWEDIKKIFNKKNPRGLRVFGQYSYEDVQTNNWQITDWRERKPRSLRPVEVTSEVSASSKRKSRDSSRDTSDRHRTPVPWTTFQSRDRALSSEQLPQMSPFMNMNMNENDLSFAGTTLSPTSPLPQTMVDYQNNQQLPEICVDRILEPDDMFLPFESAGNSDADLIQIGSSSHLADTSFSAPKAMTGNGLALQPNMLDQRTLQDFASSMPFPTIAPSSTHFQKRPTKVALPHPPEHYRRHWQQF